MQLCNNNDYIYTYPIWQLNKYFLSPQVEIELFPDMKEKKLFLRSVHVDEALVQDYMDQAVDVFKLNTVGPQKYAQLIQ